MKIEVKDYHDVWAIENYWIGRTYGYGNGDDKIAIKEHIKWERLRKHLEELAGVKEAYGDNN